MTLSDLELVPAELGHAKLLFGWRNEPEIVSLGRTRSTVEWEEHIRWLGAVLEDPRSLFFIVQVEGEPIGQVRFDPASNGTAEVSIYLMGQTRGRGIGLAVLREACSAAFDRLALRKIIAVVRRDNTSGRRLFERASFILEDDSGVDEFAHYTYQEAD